MKPFKVFAVVLPGLEEYAEIELSQLGIKKTTLVRGGIEFACHPRKLYYLNNFTRISTRFLVRVGTLKAKSFSEFENKFLKIDLKGHIGSQPIEIKVSCQHCKLYHTGAIIERVHRYLKKPINNKHESIEPQRIYINGKDDEFMISIDSSGENLHKRGVMKYRGQAPLRETIAGAMLQAARVEGDLWDPMCGSGTLPIEYFIQQSNAPMGLSRSFAFECWPSFESVEYQKILSDAKGDIQKPENLIEGSDIEEAVLELAKKNSRRIENGENINFFCKDFNLIQSKEIKNNKKLTIICNPPYGERLQLKKGLLNQLIRLSEKNEMIKLYVLIPNNFVNTKWRVLFKCKNGGLQVAFCELKQ